MVPNGIVGVDALQVRNDTCGGMLTVFPARSIQVNSDDAPANRLFTG